MAARAADVAQQALYQFAWRVQLATVYVGSGLVLIRGVLLCIGRFKFLTGWLLLGVLLYVAVAGLDGAFLAPNLRRVRTAAGGRASCGAGAAVDLPLWVVAPLLAPP